MRLIPLFAVEDDLSLVLRLVESKRSLNYVPMGQFERPPQERYSAHGEVPSLGVATSDASVTCQSYLVIAHDTNLNLRPIVRRDGSRVFAIDQLLNPDSIALNPGGRRHADVVIAGEVGTASDSATSVSLMKSFDTALRKTFRRIRAFRVGPKAEQLLDAGARLTVDIHASRSLDLAR